MNTPQETICQLGREFYQLGWVSGTGGGISIRDENKVYVAPSGVQKERIRPEEIFTIDAKTRAALHEPAGLKLSACAPIFFAIYERTNAGAVIHNHSIPAARVTHTVEQRFKITGIEMQKGILGYDVFDMLHVPILENVSHEKDLAAAVRASIEQNPNTTAVLIRGHGVYVWGTTWEHAKTQAECYDYLFRISLEESARGIDLSKPQRRYTKAYHLDTATPVSPQHLAANGIILDNVTDPIAFLQTKRAEDGYLHQDRLHVDARKPRAERLGLEEKLFAFEREHKHQDDEVRYITGGEGIFDVRDSDDRWVRIEVEREDYILIPAGRYHRFFLTQEKNITATRLFKDKEGWVPEYRAKA
ncbi:methylthioribulose 1-phosphate dehydratase [Candidatus Woesearchaeota archaeon]|nr:MAG: methylthioribulose 1-phosphate dehydratase [Candidatus Woesearchaeota archaeon]